MMPASISGICSSQTDENTLLMSSNDPVSRSSIVSTAGLGRGVGRARPSAHQDTLHAEPAELVRD